jgi:uncharacterized membrane protein
LFLYNKWCRLKKKCINNQTTLVFSLSECVFVIMHSFDLLSTMTKKSNTYFNILTRNVTCLIFHSLNSSKHDKMSDCLYVNPLIKRTFLITIVIALFFLMFFLLNNILQFYASIKLTTIGWCSISVLTHCTHIVFTRTVKYYTIFYGEALLAHSTRFFFTNVERCSCSCLLICFLLTISYHNHSLVTFHRKK